MGLKVAFRFLKDLKKNNSRDWMHAHKIDYENAKNETLELVADLLKGMKVIHPSFDEIPPESCFFRIHRDVRFSKNKEPYKTNMGVALNLYGRKSFRPGYYLHLEPGGVFLAGGMFQPPTDVLARVRSEIDFQAKDFLKLIQKPAFRQRIPSFWQEDKLVKVPKGFEPGSPVADYLKLKSFIASVAYTDTEANSPDFSKLLIKDMKLMWPFIQFLDQPLGD
jgi:uncharacterized protein (TIGR02453 family)